MKKIISLILALVMCLAVFCGCTNNEPVDNVSVVSDLENAKNYIYTMYKDTNPVTPADYDVVGLVKIGDVEFPITWTTDSDTITITPNDKMVTIDVDEQNPEEVNYVLTATVADAEGNTLSCSFEKRVPAAIIIDAGMSYAEIVDAAYNLEDGIALEDTYRLFGEIISIDTPYSADYKNITVTIQIGDLTDKPIMCYRLKGEGVENLAVGDKITVEGILKNYKGTIEFDAGCAFLGYGEIADQSAILEAAYAVAEGLTMNAPTALRGVITTIDTPYSEEYKNVTVTIVCDGDETKPIMCYRLKGENAATLAVGDEIAVAGTIKNYKGTIEFDAGCVLIPLDAVADAKTVFAAYQLEEGIAMTESSTLTGVITNVDTPYSADYQNVTVTIVVAGLEDYPIMCYRLKGEGADTIAVGNTITVSGTFKNYKGTIEFDAGCTLDAVK